jgi:F0F1-type ATP synthase membrane subunit b/b'
MFLQLDGTFWVQLVNFAIFYAIVRVIFLAPVGEAIRKRRAYIDGVQHDYDAFTRQARALRAEADAKRALARREAEELVMRARASAEQDGGKIAGDYADKAAEIADDARRTVEAELTAARRREAELAGTLGQTLLQRAMGALGA